MKIARYIQKIINIVIRWVRISQYARPTLFFLFFLVICAALAVMFEMNTNGQFNNIIDGFWWVIITFSTTGYGDKVPVTIGGRIIAILTILIGITGMSLLSGGLASWLVERNTRARRGLVDYSYLKNHIIVCGWKPDMADILLGMIASADDLSGENIVIISNVPSERIDALHDRDELRAVRFVHGDYFSETPLLRAGVKKAKKVMILADSLESHGVTEVDSKTVLAVLTIKSISREVYVTAELLDKKYESYLKQAACDEILFSQEMSRHLLASASHTNGLSHIFYALLSHNEHQVRLTTVEIPAMFIERTYTDFKEHVEKQERCQLIGVLENAGSPARMKIDALRSAQKTSDVSRLINNLQRVKGLEVNRPVFTPPSDYKINANSLGILVEHI